MNQMTRIVAAPVDGFKARFTTAEFLKMIELGAFGDIKVDLVDGELERMPPPGNAHGLLQIALLSQLIALAGVARVRAEQGIDLGDDTLVACDGALLRAPVTDKRMLTAADLLLVIEVAETTFRRDSEMKRTKYAGAGVPLYWVVDSRRSVVHVYQEPTDGDYIQVHTVRFGEPLSVPGTSETITLS
ncbi:Uma2 family endonuclease [Sphingomonas sp.]|uniref:Uma2 family endonuclease n=1 Tax=Sphingomonas sp. TaxID=28214 RepID=UPI003AFFC0F0